jgi:methionyl aminopeptidase
MNTRIKTKEEIEAMRIAGRVLASTLRHLSAKVEVGMNTKELAKDADKLIRENPGAEPAFLGYEGFPDVICISINHEVVHGIPKEDRIINNGDIVSLDLGVRYRGMIVDGAVSVIAGDQDKDKIKFLDITRQSLNEGLKQIKHGCRVGDIGFAIESVLKKAGYGIVRDLVGHGVGHEIHEDPNIPNYGKKGSGPILLEGMTVAIEPMATLGGEYILVEEDGWTVSTRDTSLSCHFEHTILVTKSGYEILTII